MLQRKYPIATDQGTANVTGYSWAAASLIGIHRDGAQGPWAVTFLPTGTTINSLFNAERYMAAPYLLERIERIERAEPLMWEILAALPFGQENGAPDEFQFAVDAIKLAAAQS